MMHDLTEAENENAVVAELARRAAEVHKLAEHVVGTVNDQGALAVLDLEQYGEFPRRKRGHVTVTETDSLARYVNAHKIGGATSLWADRDTLTVRAIIDGHGEGAEAAAGFEGHRATLKLAVTPEWAAWNAHSGKLISQHDFGEFLEDHATNIVEPAAADMLDLARTFEATKSVEFKSGQRATSGEVQLTYAETIASRAGNKGTLEIPERLVLGLQPFRGANTYRVGARFRYRINDGTLTLGFVLDRPDLVLDAAFGDVLAALQEATEIAPFHGQP